MDLTQEVAEKVRDNLAGLVAATCNANEPFEKNFAKAALAKRRLRVVLHLEQPNKTSRLFPQSVKPANVLQKLKQLLKPIDPHPLVLDKSGSNSAHWTVA